MSDHQTVGYQYTILRYGHRTIQPSTYIPGMYLILYAPGTFLVPTGAGLYYEVTFYHLLTYIPGTYLQCT